MTICFIILNKFFNLKKMCSCDNDDTDEANDIKSILIKYQNGE